MEETPKEVKIGKWRALPSIPLETEISIGQRTVLHRGKIYSIFGVQRQVHINCFDIESNSWYEHDSYDKDVVQKSQYHSLFVHNNRIYIFGGTQLIGIDFYLENRLCYLDLHTFKWHKVEDKGAVPEPMYLHSGLVYDNCLYTFGGKMTHEGNDCINKMYKFDIETEIWTQVEAKGDIPSPRRAHGAAIYEDSMYIFGGWNGVQTFGDFYKFDFGISETSTWTEIEVKNGPQARQLDYMVQYGGKLYIYGGEGGKKYLNDFWSYDIAKNEWAEITDDDKLTNFGRYANALVLNDNVLYMFGGSAVQALDDLHCITLPVVHKEYKPKTLFEKLQHDMKTLRLGQSAPYNFAISSKKKDLTVQGHEVIYAARVPLLLEALRGNNVVDLSKKLTNGLSEWIYEDKISAIEKYSLGQLENLLEFAKKYEIAGLLDLVECEYVQRLDPDLLFYEVDYAILTPRIKKMCAWIWDNLPQDADLGTDDEVINVLESIEVPDNRPSVEYTHTLSRDLLRVRQMSEYSDVIVKANDIPLNLHLFMINLRFPYFKGLIGFGTNKLTQSASGSVEVNEHSLHIPFSAFNSIIDYTYSSELIFEPQDYFPIASEASFYMIDDDQFYADLTEKFQQMITKQNSRQLYDIAASYGSSFSDIMEYISSHYLHNENKE